MIVRGAVTGDLTAVERIDLAAPAQIQGNLSTPRLSISEGVFFEGTCAMPVPKEDIEAEGIEEMDSFAESGDLFPEGE